MPFFFRNLLPRRARNRTIWGVGSPTLAVGAGHLTLASRVGTRVGKVSMPVTAGHLTLAGKTIALTASLVVGKGSLLLSGKTIALFFETFLPGHLTLAASSVNFSTLVPPSTRAPLLIPSTGNKRATRWRGVPQR